LHPQFQLFSTFLELIVGICSLQGFGLTMDPIGKAMLARTLMEVGTMAINSTVSTGEDQTSALVPYSPSSYEKTIIQPVEYITHRTVPSPTPYDWEAIRPVFTYYYINRNLPLRAVRNILDRQYGFNAT
jgi:Clr5 domain